MKDPFVYIAYYTFKCHEIVDASTNFIKSYKFPWHDLKKKWPRTVSIAWANENHLPVYLEKDQKDLI